MLGEDIYAFRSELQKRDALFAYTGFVSEDLLYALGTAVKQQLELKKTEGKVVRRVFSVFVEQVQNVIRYSGEQEWLTEPKTARLSAGVIVLGQDDNRFFVICGNAVTNEEADGLKTRLESISGMDGEALRKHYRTKLREDPDPHSEGATIGLLEIARRVTQPLEYDFLKLDENRSFFVLKAFI
ncbi:SiaB family protein kinase [Roseibium sp.]|uniref:SiaB family protein kinase n=1 Tax=Roseibium sp. TaxID=1936156 RepID=UPI003BAE872D